MFVAYVYNTNTILMQSMPDIKPKTQVKAYKEIYNYFTYQTLKPMLHVINNEYSKMVEEHIVNKEQTQIQFVEAHFYQGNATKRAIQIFRVILLQIFSQEISCFQQSDGANYYNSAKLHYTYYKHHIIILSDQQT